VGFGGAGGEAGGTVVVRFYVGVDAFAIDKRCLVSLARGFLVIINILADGIEIYLNPVKVTQILHKALKVNEISPIYLLLPCVLATSSPKAQALGLVPAPALAWLQHLQKNQSHSSS